MEPAENDATSPVDPFQKLAPA
eukprot:SAG31_NODE_46959_length_252_cov_0.679739_1_plen_21_part_01